MKTNTLNQNKTIETKFNQAIKELNKAEITAWALFIGVGITYVVLSLFVAI